MTVVLALRARVRPPPERRPHRRPGDAPPQPRPDRRAQGAHARGRRWRARPPRPRTAARASSWRRRATTCASRCTRSACSSPRSASGARRRARAAGARACEAALAALEAQFAQLIDLSRLEAGALEPARERVPLGAAVRPRSRASSASRRRPAAWRSWLVRTRLAVESDPLLLERMLRNLFANALRYTRAAASWSAPGGAARASRSRSSTAASASRPSIASASSTSSSRCRDAPDQPRAAGMGLGLAIVRRFAALLGHRTDARERAGARLALLHRRAARRRRDATARRTARIRRRRSPARALR